MKFGFTFLFSILLAQLAFSQPAVSVIYLPQYVHAAGTATANRTPYVCRLKLTGLTANATYRYYCRFAPSGGSATAGEGAFIYVKQSGEFVRIPNPNLATTANPLYGELTTDGLGTYTGWFMAEVAATATFNAGNKLKFRIFLNNGAGGQTVVAPRPTTTQEITVVNFGTGSTEGTAIRSTPVTGGIGKNFVLLWDKDNITGADQPISGSVIESDGVDASNSFASFYVNDVNGIDKAWGTVIPNNVTAGIRRISQYSLATGNEVGYKLSSDGNWPVSGGGRASTVNTTGGLTNVIVLDGAVARLDGANVRSDQTITFNTLTAKTYGDADFDPAATISSGLPASYTSDNTTVASIISNQVHVAGAGSANITAAQAGDDFYNAATAVAQPLTVNKASLTITANDDRILQGTAIPTFTVSYSGFVNGETETSLATLPTATTTATSASPDGMYDIVPGGAASPNYTFTYVKGTLTITASQQPQSITFGALATKTYGDVDFDPGAQASSGLQVAYASSNTGVATIINGKIHITGAGTTTITASQGGTSAWHPAADVSQSFTVNKAALTITADNKTRLVGQPNPTFTVTYTGFVNGETNTVLTTQPVAATTAGNTSQAGTYDITVSGATADNYDISYVKGVLKIDPLAVQTITFATLPAKKYGDTEFKLSATASSRLPVTYSSSNAAVATIQNDTVYIHSAGTTVITASQAGDATYESASAMQTLTVQKVRLYIQANDVTKNEGEVNPPLTITYSGFVKNEDSSELTSLPVVTTSATATSIAGTYPITISGAASPNYTIAQLNGTLNILPAQGAAQDNMFAYISSPGQMQVNVYAVTGGKGVVQLFDQNGTRLVQVNVTLVKGHNTFHIPTGNVLKGLYHVRVAIADVLLKGKIIIQ
ncbi:hypothetical protein FAM09_11910 [Niastella caeni]|uniref:MBG domain-containing protein n=1 Tax=Niastella caeni TaxID=2569763 RepID=A0A4S8HUD3_9BACT|nr:MBG domain-containing protein [Niastella caeni]THU39213.1 hypothetical protein FAM09_11910 [Niastella caeni]